LPIAIHDHESVRHHRRGAHFGNKIRVTAPQRIFYPLASGKLPETNNATS
jgi:hypothetical protein